MAGSVFFEGCKGLKASFSSNTAGG